jgi:hypothetical protein
LALAEAGTTLPVVLLELVLPPVPAVGGIVTMALLPPAPAPLPASAVGALPASGGSPPTGWTGPHWTESAPANMHTPTTRIVFTAADSFVVASIFKQSFSSPHLRSTNRERSGVRRAHNAGAESMPHPAFRCRQPPPAACLSGGTGWAPMATPAPATTPPRPPW